MNHQPSLLIHEWWGENHYSTGAATAWGHCTRPWKKEKKKNAGRPDFHIIMTLPPYKQIYSFESEQKGNKTKGCTSFSRILQVKRDHYADICSLMNNEASLFAVFCSPELIASVKNCPQMFHPAAVVPCQQFHWRLTCSCIADNGGLLGQLQAF